MTSEQTVYSLLTKPNDDVFKRANFRVTVCDYSLRKSANPMDIFFQDRDGILTHSNGNSANGFPIVPTTFKDFWSCVYTFYCLCFSCVLWLVTSDTDITPQLDIKAVLGIPCFRNLSGNL